MGLFDEATEVKEEPKEVKRPAKPVMTEIEKSLIDQIKIAFYALGPLHSKMDVRTVLKEKHYRINWWSKMLNGDNTISLSIFVTVVKTPTGYDFVNETASEKPYLKRD